MKNLLLGMLDDIYGGKLIEIATDAVMIPPDLFDSMISGLSGAVMPIASVLVTIYFIMAVLDKVTSDSFNVEQFMKLLLKLILSIVIIENAPEWSRRIMDFGSDFTSLLGVTTGSFTSYEITETVIPYGFVESLFTFIVMVIPWLASLLIKMAVYFLGYGRAIEMGIRAALSPIGLADIITGGANSNGFKYLKKMIAISMQGGLMMIAIAAASVVCNSQLPDSASVLEWAFVAKYLGIMLSMVGIMASCKSIANELVGA